MAAWRRLGPFDEDAAVAAIRGAPDLGVDFFDIAQAYGFGASERLLVTSLRHKLSHNRSDLVIATKGVLHQTDSGLTRDASPDWLRKGVDGSLTALRIDHIDLYPFHWPDPTVPAAETAIARADQISAIKIGHVDVSNYNSTQMAEFSATLPVAKLRALGKFAANRGVTVGQLEIAWTLANPAVHVAIVGARHAGHVEDSLRAVETPLTDSDFDEIETIMDEATPVAGPSPEGMP